MSDEGHRLHIDSDWKAQAQAEKERLAEKEAARSEQEPAGELPPADFRALVATLGSQAMMGLGAYGDPQTGRVIIDLAGAQFAIDLLGVIEEKTKGNLTPDESAELTEILQHLRARFVQIAQMVAAQMAREGGVGSAGGMGAGGVGPIGSIGPQGAAGASGAPTAGSTTKSGLIIPD